MELNPRQETFCHEYILDSNGTQAAIRAGYSEKTATAQATELLTRDYIKERITVLTQKALRKAPFTAQDVLEGIWDMAKKAKSETVRLRAHELAGNYCRLFGEENGAKLPIPLLIMNAKGEELFKLQAGEPK